MTYFAEVMMQTLFIVIICFFQIRQLDLNQISYLVKVGNDFLTNGENNLLTYIWNVCNAIDMFRHEIQIISYHIDFYSCAEVLYNSSKNITRRHLLINIHIALLGSSTEFSRFYRLILLSCILGHESCFATLVLQTISFVYLL